MLSAKTEYGNALGSVRRAFALRTQMDEGEAALYIVRKRIDEEQASQLYKVSKEVIRMRLNVTGARNRVKKQRSWKKSI